VATRLCQYVRQSVELWAIPELERCGRIQPHVSKAFSGVAVLRSESDVDCKLNPSGITPALHLAMAEITRQVRDEILSEQTVKAF
jgi:hypothetical protein